MLHKLSGACLADRLIRLSVTITPSNQFTMNTFILL